MGTPSHHTFDSRFRNPWRSAQQPTWKDVTWKIPLSWYPAKTQNLRPPIKVVEPDWSIPTAQKAAIVGTWLGHATCYARFPTVEGQSDDLSVLFDPIFSMRAGPNAYIGPARFNKPPCGVSDLPSCDVVCISHNHYDHLDLPSVRQILEFWPNAEWYVPLGIRSWLVECGIQPGKVREMDWWDGQEVALPSNGNKSITSSFRITCVPAQHTSGRTGLDTNATLWCGWVIERFNGEASGQQQRSAVYHAGDTGYRASATSSETCPVFKEIGDKFGGFDLSFIPIWRGGSLSWVSSVGLRLDHDAIASWNHCDPKDAVNIHKDVKSRNSVAMHFGTFVGSQKESDEALNDFYAAIAEAKVGRLDAVEDGGTGRVGAIDIGGSIVVALR